MIRAMISETQKLSHLKPTRRCPRCSSVINKRGSERSVARYLEGQEHYLFTFWEECPCGWTRRVEDVQIGV